MSTGKEFRHFGAEPNGPADAVHFRRGRQDPGRRATDGFVRKKCRGLAWGDERPTGRLPTCGTPRQEVTLARLALSPNGRGLPIKFLAFPGEKLREVGAAAGRRFPAPLPGHNPTACQCATYRLHRCSNGGILLLPPRRRGRLEASGHNNGLVVLSRVTSGKEVARFASLEKADVASVTCAIGWQIRRGCRHTSKALLLIHFHLGSHDVVNSRS